MNNVILSSILLANIVIVLLILSTSFFNSGNHAFGQIYESKSTDGVVDTTKTIKVIANDKDSRIIDNESILPKTVDESIGSIMNVITSGMISESITIPSKSEDSSNYVSEEIPDTYKIKEKTSLTNATDNVLENDFAEIIQTNDAGYLLKLVEQPGRISTSNVFVGDKNEILMQAENICKSNEIDLSLCKETVNNALEALDFTEAIMGESKIRLNLDKVSMDIFSDTS